MRFESPSYYYIIEIGSEGNRAHDAMIPELSLDHSAFSSPFIPVRLQIISSSIQDVRWPRYQHAPRSSPIRSDNSLRDRAPPLSSAIRTSITRVGDWEHIRKESTMSDEDTFQDDKTKLSEPTDASVQGSPRFSLKITKKPVPDTPRGVLAE